MPIQQVVSGLLALLSGGWAQALALPAQAAPARWTPELAFTVKRVGVVAISPDGRWAAVEVAEPVMEAELSEWRPSVHVYPVGAAGQRAWRVETPASSPAWSPDGRWLAFMSNRSGKRNVWRVGLDGTPAEQLTDVVGELGEFRWSPDGRRLAYLVTDPPAEEELRQVQEKRDARVVGEAYRFARLYSFDRRPAIVGWTRDARAVVISEARGTVARLSALPAGGGAAVDLSPDTLMVSAPTLNPAGTYVGFVAEAPDRAPEPYVSRLMPFAPLRVAALQSLPAIPLGRTESIRWRSFDGREIEGLVRWDGRRPRVRRVLLRR